MLARQRAPPEFVVLNLESFFDTWNGDPKHWAAALASIVVGGPELSAKVFGCNSRTLRRMVTDGRFVEPSLRAPSSANDDQTRGLWFVQTCEFWLCEYTKLEAEFPERVSRENAEEATRLAIVFDANLKKTLQHQYQTRRDVSHEFVSS